MPNLLISETSPYLLQHAHNPVDWYPWGEEAFSKARAENKPIFLSIGYSACHWCHVMERESFENPETAAIMNLHFVSIKVDREERPDLDSIYMQVTTTMTGSGGWPMSVFLTPDLLPFFAGTYFPPTTRHNMPSFPEILHQLADAWSKEREAIERIGKELLRAIRSQPQAAGEQHPFTTEILEEATTSLLNAYDWKHGGWGEAPKFPQPMTIEFLLQRLASHTPQGDQILRACQHALDAMARGGMFDVVGGGFARYSVDVYWRTPHFEKMLTDNALLAKVYLHAHLATGETRYRRVCEQTLDFILQEMTLPGGGFTSSLDADSGGEEGLFYVWTSAEIEDVLGQEYEFFRAAYGITDEGNWEGKTILQRALDDSSLLARFPDLQSANGGDGSETITTRLAACHADLLAIRNTRPRPAADDKIITFWNALTLNAFAEAGRYLNRDDYLDAAIRNARFLLENLYIGDRWMRSWREGQAKHNAFLEDHASLITGLLALYQSDPDPQWYQAALKTGDEMVMHFVDPTGGFFDTRDDHETLLFRPGDLQDHATPSGNALAAMALLQLSEYGDRPGWSEITHNLVGKTPTLARRFPNAFAQWLCAGDFYIGPRQEVAILGDPGNPSTQALVRALWMNYRPHLVAAISCYPPAPGSPALVFNRPLLNDAPTAYVCRGFSCLQPVNSVQDLEIQLKD